MLVPATALVASSGVEPARIPTRGQCRLGLGDEHLETLSDPSHLLIYFV